MASRRKTLSSRALTTEIIVCRYEERRNSYRVLVRNPEGKRLLGRNKRGWAVDIRIVLKKAGWENVDWIYVAQLAATV